MGLVRQKGSEVKGKLLIFEADAPMELRSRLLTLGPCLTRPKITRITLVRGEEVMNIGAFAYRWDEKGAILWEKI